MTEAVGPRSPRIYNLFPLLVGPVGEWMKAIPRIAAMGFNWIYVNPFQTPGFSGSIYAIKDYRRINPLLRGQTYEDDSQLIRSFCEIAAMRGLNVMMDIVINHTSRDCPLTNEHPDWYVRDDKGELVSPGTQSLDDPSRYITWGDLAEIDYSDRPQRQEITAYWCALIKEFVSLGVRGFRCDAAYKVPAAVWQTIMEAAYDANPDVLFFAETLGCQPEQVENLAPAHFDYFFNSSKWWDFQQPWLLKHHEVFRRIAPSISFTETHDTRRLAVDLRERGITDVKAQEFLYKQRYLFATFFSSGVMMPVGYEYGFQTPLDVVTTRPEQWEPPRFDISSFIAQANRLKATSAVLNRDGPIRRIDSPTGAVGLLRFGDEEEPEWVFALLNPCENCKCSISINGSDPLGAITVRGSEKTPQIALQPGMTACLDKSGCLSLLPGEVRIFSGSSSLF